MKLLTTLLMFLLTMTAMSQVGYPDRSSGMNALKGFKSPPRGYGEVSFYWWQADTLTKERLTWQLDELAKKKITSLQVNYSHTDDKKGLFWGSSYPSKPGLFTEEWWELFGWFIKEANFRGMSVSLSDYTLGVGQGFSIDQARTEDPSLLGHQLSFEKKEFDKELSWELKNTPVSLVVYNADDPAKATTDLTKLITSNSVKWSAPEGKWIALYVSESENPNSYDPMHPHSGAAYVNHFLRKFEDKFPELTKKGGLNFFFSDELNFNLNGFIWNDIFASEFQRRKGYDVRAELASLYTDMGVRSPKIRLDYNDVMVSLSEEHFFKPVYDWHAERGLIYGCDHGGRGKIVDEFGDYFRTQRWNQAPGCDQPRLGKDLIKNKVAASIAHMYERPRVWLEGFYSSGWGTTSANLTDAIFANFAMGQNLLSLHGLYYATPASMWEWAPPCNHFRMPYWQIMEPLFDCVERLSYIMSQGHHVCDVAILYPVEPVVAGYGMGSVNTSFELAKSLYANNIDFDFMDYESLHRGVIINSELKVAGESFKVIIVPSMKAIKQSSLDKLKEFKQKGGVVIVYGENPIATDKYGDDSINVKPLVEKPVITSSEMISIVESSKTRDFKILDESVKTEDIQVMHRKIGDRDVYALYNIPESTECFFRAVGVVEYWDAWSGETFALDGATQTKDGTILRTPKGKKEFQLIVFSPNKTTDKRLNPTKIIKTTTLDNYWFCSLKPALNNKFGDYILPATDKLITPQVRKFKSLITESNWQNARSEHLDWSITTYTYGPEFLKLGPISAPLTIQEIRNLGSNKLKFEPYEFSRKWGVEDDAGHQGYHGMKMEMNPEVIRLGTLARSSTSTNRTEEESGKYYYLYTTVIAPESGVYNILYGAVKPSVWYLDDKEQASVETIKLNKGHNKIVLCYDSPVVTYFFIQNPRVKSVSDEPMSLRWFKDPSILMFDVNPERVRKQGWYAFKSAPGLKAISFNMKGKYIKVWINQREMAVVTSSLENSLGYAKYTITLPDQILDPADVTIRVVHEDGVYAGAAFDSPIEQDCGSGRITLGDFTKIDGMSSYSGGIIYNKSFFIKSDDIKYRIRLNLGDLSSAAELVLNGKVVGVKLSPDWIFDITDHVKAGMNYLEILVYNTAANHYSTIPTVFKGNPKSGLFGPVSIEFIEDDSLKLK